MCIYGKKSCCVREFIYIYAQKINVYLSNITEMKKFVSVLALSGFLLAGTSTEVSAVPADPRPIKITLVDGTELTVRLHGDESNHFYTTEDNYVIAEGNDGRYYYATQNLTLSNIVVTDVAHRSLEAKNFLQKIDRERQWNVQQSKATRMFARGFQSDPEKAAPSFPTTGTQKGLVILVDYPDVKFTVENPKQAFHDLLNKEGYSEFGAKGSAADYYKECSTGQFTPAFDVYGPVTLPNNRIFYGGNDSYGNDKNPHLMAVHACELLDDQIDFTEYDRDNDGFIDNVYVFYAGNGEANSGVKAAVWPHSWDVYKGTLEVHMFDGVQLDHYACSNEINAGKKMEGIGTFCHEFNHVLGFPDLYATTYTNSFTPQMYTIMDQGSYNNNGHTPPFMTVYERFFFKWLTPKEIGETGENITLNPISSNEGLIIRTPKENEYFLLENRQQDGWDTYIPGHGMLIWHIDYRENVWKNNVVNNSPTHQYVDIEEADNLQTTRSFAGDPFPGTKKVTEFTDQTKPSMLPWSKKPLNKPITDIVEADGLITFKIKGGSGSGIADIEAQNAELTIVADAMVMNNTDAAMEAMVYTQNGQLVRKVMLEPGANTVCQDLNSGVYVLVANGQSYKMIR